MDAVIVRSEVANIPSQTELVSRDRKQEANDIQVCILRCIKTVKFTINNLVFVIA